jgi:Flp pilus assembly protein TadG
MRRLPDLLSRFRKDERGVFLVIFALLAVVIIAASGAVVDFTRVQQARTRAQIALDAAALALQATINNTGVTADTLKAKAQLLLTERIADSSVTAVVEAATPNTATGQLTITGYISVPTYFVQLVGIKDIRSTMLSEVTRSSSDLEVSLSIDITGSMARVTCQWWEWNCEESDKIGALISASRTLITTLVSTTQTPTYSKMAIVPWSNVVNPGSYLTSVRGTPNTSTTNVTAASWSTGTAKSIQSITKGSSVTTINSTGHGFVDGNVVYITSVGGLTNSGNSCINNRSYVVDQQNANRYTIQLNSNSCTNATNNTGSAIRCEYTSCDLKLTSNNHGQANGAGVRITAASWLGGNPIAFIIGNVTTNTFTLNGKFGPTSSAYASGGKVWCGYAGCSRRVFMDGSDLRDYPVAPCVTERTTNYNTDSSPSGSPLGYYYNSAGTCLTNQIVPLTSSISTLETAIGPATPIASRTLIATGATAGHLGLAWGWYMIAPNFAYVWPSTAPAPKAYGSTNLIKAIIFMTDGLFNTYYCSGVTNGQACTNANGDAKAQAQAICNAIKVPANHTELYVVGFDLADDEDTLEFLEGCATSVDHFFQADTGEDLAAAFDAIAGNLSELRISK